MVDATAANSGGNAVQVIDQPDVVGLPDRADGVCDKSTPRAAHIRPASKKIPEPGAESAPANSA
jgi:hypothetical protein